MIIDNMNEGENIIYNRCINGRSSLSSPLRHGHSAKIESSLNLPDEKPNLCSLRPTLQQSSSSYFMSSKFTHIVVTFILLTLGKFYINRFYQFIKSNLNFYLFTVIFAQISSAEEECLCKYRV